MRTSKSIPWDFSRFSFPCRRVGAVCDHNATKPSCSEKCVHRRSARIFMAEFELTNISWTNTHTHSHTNYPGQPESHEKTIPMINSQFTCGIVLSYFFFLSPIFISSHLSRSMRSGRHHIADIVNTYLFLIQCLPFIYFSRAPIVKYIGHKSIDRSQFQFQMHIWDIEATRKGGSWARRARGTPPAPHDES